MVGTYLLRYDQLQITSLPLTCLTVYFMLETQTLFARSPAAGL